MKGRIIVIGASFNGIDALSRLVRELPANLPAPVFIVQHLSAHSPGLLPQILSSAGPLPASHPRPSENFEPGRIYVAPPDRHMLLERGRVRLSHGPRENFTRPAVDPLFRSAALAYGPAVVAVVLTGHLDDGTAGLLAVKQSGGTAVVQEPAEATAPSMPQSALRHVQVDYRLPVKEIAGLLVMLASDDPAEGVPAPQRSLLEIEHRTAAGDSSVEDWLGFEKMSAPSGLNCPDCRSALYEVRDPPLLRFRCRSGHACSPQSLLAQQADVREMQLSSLFGAAMEEAALAHRMLGLPGYAEDVRMDSSLRARVDLVERQARQVAEWLHATTGLVDPEPPLPNGRESLPVLPTGGRRLHRVPGAGGATP